MGGNGEASHGKHIKYIYFLLIFLIKKKKEKEQKASTLPAPNVPGLERVEPGPAPKERV